EPARGGQGNWIELWPTSKMMAGDPSASSIYFGQDAAEAGRFEAPSSISRGSTRPWFIRGTCKDSGGNPLGGAAVQCFRTSDDLFVSQVGCDDRGQYEVPTPYPGVAHYLVAQYASGSLAGSTVDTLIPTL
ncbi:MAG: hypothetical protein HXX15_22930, partial [Rhodopseudomonas sp.]|uniref:hypothetical protein n=1 Tax=Rhodopseudomonas sp. TaxID=1078 RepID=UPI0017BC888A